MTAEMGDILALVVFGMLISFGGAGAYHVYNKLGQGRHNIPIEGPHRVYDIARRSAQISERLLRQDELIPILTDTDRRELQAIVRDFNRL